MKNSTITINAIIDSPVAKVWDSYTTAEHITRWNFAVKEWHCPHAQNDLRVGGRFSIRMEAKDGSFGFDFTGVYTKVKPQHSFSYTMDDGRKVDITFTTKDKSTQMSIIFEAETTNSLEMQRGGWQSILDNFKKYVESK
jgi:uncharacterized protein YndB with AHSA1/START domain